MLSRIISRVTLMLILIGIGTFPLNTHSNEAEFIGILDPVSHPTLLERIETKVPDNAIFERMIGNDEKVTSDIEYNLATVETGPWRDWEHYHNYTEIVDTLLYLNSTFPDIVDVFSIGKSWKNLGIYCIRLTNENITRKKPKVFFVGYHHARERISAELTLYFAVGAATQYGVNETMTFLLDYCEIYIVVALNVDGFEAVEANEWQRKNAHPFDEDEDGLFDEDPPDDEDGDGYIENLFFWNGTHYEFIRWEGVDDDGDGLLNEDWVGGVDLNRNYGYQWNATVESGSPYPWAEDYQGPEPFSEKETQAIRDLALQHNFTYAISFHSGAETIVYPWGYTSDSPPHNEKFIQIAEEISQIVGCSYIQGGNWYTTSGVWDDWMYGNRSTFAFTCEIYVNSSALQYEPGPQPDTWWQKGVFQFFNPAPDQIQTVVQRWLPVFIYIVNRTIAEGYNIAITEVTPTKTVVGQGFTMKINITVANEGIFTENLQVTVYANTTSIASQTLAVAANSTMTLAFTWNTTGFDKSNYTIGAYATPVSGELNVIDNSLADSWVIIAMVGDLTGGTENPWDFVPDGKVDIMDIAVVALTFGIYSPDPGYEPNCDLNSDGKIDILDVATVAVHFGETDP